MNILLQILFWLSVAGLFYVFAGYPILINLLSRIRPGKVQKGTWRGPISVLISVYNEGGRITRKLDNLFASDCAGQITEVLIGSDGSSDNTQEVVAAYPDKRVRLVHCEERRGKPAMINVLVPMCQNELVVLQDVRQDLEPDAISRLAANFHDARVGAVSGELVFRQQGAGTTAAQGIGFYWKYEKFIRKSEARFRSVPGATGALYAIRKQLYRQIDPRTLIDDVVIPMTIIEQGYRCLLEPGAIAWDEPSQSTGQESIRKRRTIAGAAQMVMYQPRWVFPWKNPIWLEFMSHKIARLFSPLLLLTAAVTNVWLAGMPVYLVLLVLHVGIYLSALVGWLYQRAGRKSRLFGAPLMFISLNATTVAALWDAARGKFRAAWQRAA